MMGTAKKCPVCGSLNKKIRLAMRNPPKLIGWYSYKYHPNDCTYFWHDKVGHDFDWSLTDWQEGTVIGATEEEAAKMLIIGLEMFIKGIKEPEFIPTPLISSSYRKSWWG